MLKVHDCEDTGDRLSEIVAREKGALLVMKILCTVAFFFFTRDYRGEARNGVNIHLVELATAGNDLLDAELAELGLELSESLQ